MPNPPRDTLKVLVPVDFSETSRRALAWAFDYALRAPCEVHLVHVVETHLTDLVAGRADARLDEGFSLMTRQAEAELDLMVAPEDRATVGRITRHLAQGKPAQEILRLAGVIGADLIVMGSQGRSGVARLLVGSVAERVIREAECPVVCVKPAPVVGQGS